MLNAKLIGCLSLLALSSVLAEPVIANGSFEDDTKLLQNIKTEEITKDPKLLALVEGTWSKIAWGCPNATDTACSFVEMKDAPSGKRVAQIDAKINQISCFAYTPTGLTPGQWYEVSAMLRCEKTVGQGTFIQVEYWHKGNGSGTVDSEHLVGTVPWTRASVQFQAPGKEYNQVISCWQFGGPGKSWLDDVKIRKIARPANDLSRRRVLDAPFWGMFTCYANYLHQYGKDMKEAGVYWQRMGGSALAPEQQKIAADLGMAYEMCFDGMPAAKDPRDPCYPVTDSTEYRAYVENCLKQAGPTIKIWEVFNEPNNNLAWTLPGYANLLCLAGKTVKTAKPDALFATGGFACPEIGYVEACLKRGADKYLDLVLIHPYAVDEALDSQLLALNRAVQRAGRPDLAVAINETGFPTWDPATGCAPNDWFVSEKDQASKVVKLHLQALAHKLSFVTYLGWNDFTENSDQAKNMGLVRVDGSPKPSYYAYRFMTKTIGNRKVATWSYQANTGARVYTFTGDKPVWAVWNALNDTDVVVDTGATEVFLCDALGTKLTIKPECGKITIKATKDPVYLVPIE
jgi:hypothetical protein